MKKSLMLLKQEFESSSGLTQEFNEFYHTFATEIKFNRGHFEVSGFFKLPSGKIWYFSLGDVRYAKGSFFVRTAESFKDYTGGSNQEISTDNPARFVRRLKEIVK